MRVKWSYSCLLSVAAIPLLLGSGSGSWWGDPSRGLLTSKVEKKVLQDTEQGRTASFIVLLSQQADLTQARNERDHNAQGRLVYTSLTSKAESTQPRLRHLLNGGGVHYRSYWAANAIVVSDGNRSLVEALARRPDVRKIESNNPIPGAAHGVEPPEVADFQPSSIVSPGAVEWGVQNVRAPELWALGDTGQGIVIGNADTGMKWDHPAIKAQYRGFWNGSTADHNYSWHDAIHDSVGNPCGNDSPVPCDDHGHGTHTTGTTVGDDLAGNQIGVAPGATWIGCRNMDRGTGTPDRYIDCFQFFIAPTDLNGLNPWPDGRPHVINNSWGCPPVEGCAPLTLQTIVENTEAAGIFVEVSAGNAGSTCGSVNDPPAIYDASFSTGAINSSNQLAGFSSRGPVTVDGSNRMKPNISGPGVAVRSSFPPSGYASLSGTSMAGPHVVGSVALMWAVRPDLIRDVAATKYILQLSANPAVTVSPAQTCGGTPSDQIPNNSFGYGRVDAYAATFYGTGPLRVG
jgi:subtilisin family serine protease